MEGSGRIAALLDWLGVRVRLARLVGLFAVATISLACLPGTAAASMVITAVTADSANDQREEWVELSNVSPAAVDLSGWQLEFRTASCSQLGVVVVPAGTVVAPGGWFLVASNEAVANGVPADLGYTDNDLIKSEGAIALTSSSLVDAVAWGSGVSACGEGAPAVEDLVFGASLIRFGRDSCPQDTDDNATDFDFAPDGVSPRSSASPSNTCFPAPTGYARPKGATPLRVALVPAYTTCGSPNRTHGPPLAFGSCNPPVPESAQLTVGSPDANGQTARAIGFARFGVLAGNPATPSDEADVSVSVNFTDVRKAVLSDYPGELRAAPMVRITDRLNGPAGTEPATGNDIVFPITVPCVATGDAAVGATCSVTTSFDAVTPGVAVEGKRAIWQMDRIRVEDGGADGVASTTPNSLFATQGIFVP